MTDAAPLVWEINSEVLLVQIRGGRTVTGYVVTKPDAKNVLEVRVPGFRGHWPFSVREQRGKGEMKNWALVLPGEDPEAVRKRFRMQDGYGQPIEDLQRAEKR